MFKHNNNAHIKGWLNITTQVKIANEQLCSQPDHVYTRFKLSAHDFLNDWTTRDLFDNYLWQSFHDLRAAVSYMVLCFMYTHESLSLSLLYLHILWRHCFRKENFMVNICLPLHKLAEYAETIGCLDFYLPPYDNSRILQNICFVQIQRRIWNVSKTFSWVVVHDIARILKKSPFLFKSFYFVMHARSSLFFLIFTFSTMSAFFFDPIKYSHFIARYLQ